MSCHSSKIGYFYLFTLIFMPEKTYIALTIGALFQREFEAILPILTSEDPQKELVKEFKENKYLGIKTESARERLLTDLRRRTKFAPDGFWKFYLTCTESQKKLALFFLLLNAYPVALELQLEVVVEKWKKLEKKLDAFDLHMRLDELSTSIQQVGNWSDTTKKNVTKNFLRSLKDAGLLINREINKPRPQPESFWHYFISIGESWFLEACLLSKTEREKLL